MDLATTLATAQANLAAKLLEATANPRPTYSVEGQSVSYGDYLRMIQDAMKAINEMATALVPYEVKSVAV